MPQTLRQVIQIHAPNAKRPPSTQQSYRTDCAGDKQAHDALAPAQKVQELGAVGNDDIGREDPVRVRQRRRGDARNVWSVCLMCVRGWRKESQEQRVATTNGAVSMPFRSM